MYNDKDLLWHLKRINGKSNPSTPFSQRSSLLSESIDVVKLVLMFGIASMICQYMTKCDEALQWALCPLENALYFYQFTSKWYSFIPMWYRVCTSVEHILVLFNNTGVVVFEYTSISRLLMPSLIVFLSNQQLWYRQFGINAHQSCTNRFQLHVPELSQCPKWL